MSIEKKVYPCEYPREVFDMKTSTKTFSVSALFYAASINTPVESPKKVAKPYYVYTEPFSKLLVTIITKGGGQTQTVKANIPVNDIAGLFEDARAARHADILLNTRQVKRAEGTLDKLLKGISEIKQSFEEKVKGLRTAMNAMYYYMKHGEPQPKAPAAAEAPTQETANTEGKDALYKAATAVILKTGRFKDKTPLGYLAESGNMEDAAQALEKQIGFLEKNLEKYKGNQIQIDAIRAAVEYYRNGYFAADDGQQEVQDAPEPAGTEEIILLKGEPKPNLYKPDGNLYPVYEISVKYIMGYRSPVQFQIQEYRAPVTRQASGAINVQQKDAVDKHSASVNLSWQDFANFMRRVETHMRRFEDAFAVKQLTEADTAEWQNIEARKAAEQATAQQARPQGA